MEAYFYGDPTVTSGPNVGVPDASHAWMKANMPSKYAFVDNFLKSHKS